MRPTKISTYCNHNCGPSSCLSINAGGYPLLSAAEVLTILMWGAWRGLKDKAKVYFYVQMYHRQGFPALGASSKFVEASTRYSVELRALLALGPHRNHQAQHAYPTENYA